MHLKSLFPAEHTKWLPLRPPFYVFVRKCWDADTNKAREIFNAGSRILSLMYRVLLSSSILGEHYATSVSTHSTETKSHAS